MRGFTLIELLAVIVILAIILIIAVPLIANVIESVKKSALESTTKLLLDASENNYAIDKMDGEVVDVTYSFTAGVQTVLPGTSKLLEFSGDVPKNGTIFVRKDGEIQVVLHDGKYCVTKDFSSEISLSETPLNECIIDNTPPVVVIVTNGMTGDAAATIVNASDIGLGIEKLEYKWDSATEIPLSGYTEFNNGDLIENAGPGTYYLHIRAIDKKNNVSNTVSNPFIIESYDVAKLFTSSVHSIAIMKDGTVKAWGRNNYGQLGTGNKIDTLIPTTITGLTNVKDIKVSDSNTMALLNDGTVKMWGWNAAGQLGNGNLIDQTSPVNVAITNVKEIYQNSNGMSSYALLNDGTVKTWGRNNYGQLCTGNFSDANGPYTTSLSNIKKLAVGAFHTLVLKNDNTVQVCGHGTYGAIGTGNNSNVASPTNIGLSNTKDIYTIMTSSFVLLNDGTLKAFGENGFGQLGVGDTSNKFSPLTISTNIADVFVGYYHNFAVQNDGTVKAWGRNTSGELGLNNTTNQTAPQTITGITNVKKIALGIANTIILFNDKTIKVSGNNTYGELGLGAVSNQTNFTTVNITEDIDNIYTNYTNNMFLVTDDNRYFASGKNDYGQLGTGNITNQNNFVKITAE